MPHKLSTLTKFVFVSLFATLLLLSQLSRVNALSSICSSINGANGLHDYYAAGAFEAGEVVTITLDDPSGVFYVEFALGSQSLTDVNPIDSSYTMTANAGDTDFFVHHVDLGSFSITCSSASASAANAAEPFVPRPPDDRANWLGGDNIAAVYVRADENGDPALHIYEVDADSRGELLMVVSLADVLAYAENPPAENLLIASGTNVEVYILSTGELQVNITEPATGKIFVTLYNLTTLEVTGGYVLQP